MRLLDARTLIFREFFDTQLPRYAIVSHRWGADEVSYQEFLDGTRPEGEGYQKIVKSCSWAVAQQLDWIWIDTCCIDKRSSAELTEAINSMYAWYQRSAECVAFLGDVPSGLADNNQELYPALTTSEWFTRGWTLQELLAPLSVTFVDSEWNFIGYKDELADIIMEITGIHSRFLCDAGLVHEASVAARMSWASKRRTTRLEDMAYCLLGIFDVNMPLLYGEGNKAFLRLQQQIIETSDDESIFAWTSDQTVAGMLADSPIYFSGSNDVMAFSVRPEERLPYRWTNKGLELEVNDSDMLMNLSLNPNASGLDDTQITLGCWKCDDIDIDPNIRLSSLVRNKVVTIKLQRQGATWQRVRCNELILSNYYDSGYHTPGLPVRRRRYYVTQEPLGLQSRTASRGLVGGAFRTHARWFGELVQKTKEPYDNPELSKPQQVARSAANMVYYQPAMRPYFERLHPPKSFKQAAEVAWKGFSRDRRLTDEEKQRVRELLMETLEGI